MSEAAPSLKISTVLNWARDKLSLAKIDAPEREAQILLGEIIGVPSRGLISNSARAILRNSIIRNFAIGWHADAGASRYRASLGVGNFGVLILRSPPPLLTQDQIVRYWSRQHWRRAAIIITG